jgi:hypothetical protein
MKCSGSRCARALAQAVVLSSLALPLALAQEPGPVAAERLTIKFGNGIFELLSQAHVRKVLPPSDSLPRSDRPRAGFWYEHRSADGTLRYRRVIDNPVLLVFEGPDGPKAGLPDRKEGLPSERVFSILIPRSSIGDVVALFSSPLKPDAHGEPAQQVALLPVNPGDVR